MAEDTDWEFRECFSWYDKDGDGYISSMLLPAALRSMGQYWTLSELKELAQQFPPDSQLNYREFLTICQAKHGIVPDPHDILRAFEVFDRTGSGRVLLEDVRHVLCSIGEKLTTKEFEELCAIHGIHYEGGTQQIDRDTFVKLFRVVSTKPNDGSPCQPLTPVS